MPAIGANLNARGQAMARKRALERMGFMPMRNRARKAGDLGVDNNRIAVFMTKAGVPASNTAADAPSGTGDICWNSVNNTVYRCTVYVNATTHTWSQIA